MDFQATPPTFAAINTGEPPAGNPPVLGQQVPGETGGLPAQGGLSVLSSPMAYQLQSMDAQQSSQSSQTYPTAPNNPVTVYSAPASDAQSTYPPVYPLGPSFEEPQDGDSVEQFARGGVARAAQQTRTMGRGNDTMLVHMTPGEVNSLQGLAMAYGGSLTINPETGLPEAGILGKILPMALGALGMAFGIPPVWMGALGAVGGTAVTGSLKQGLMAGLSAYGGASLAGAAGVGGALGNVGQSLGLPGAQGISGIGAASSGAGAGNAASGVASQVPGAPVDLLAQVPGGASGIGSGAGNLVTSTLPSGGISNVVQSQAPGFLGRFGNAARLGLPSSGIINQAAPMVAGMGVTTTASNAMTPRPTQYTGTEEGPDYIYEGPYTQAQRPATFYNDILNPANAAAGGLGSTAERMYFPAQRPALLNLAGDVVQPGYYNEALQGRPYNYVGMRLEPEEETTKKKRGVLGLPTRLNEGGTVDMQEGGFVMPARETAEFGNGSTNAGQRRLAAMGGIPIRGDGDGVSDSIPARIGGEQEARVADGETYFPPQAVKRLGGTDRLYSMMRKAQEARKRAAVGGDSKLLKGRG